jgi:hypothetical protein
MTRTTCSTLDAGACPRYCLIVVRVVQRGRFRVYVYVEIGAAHHEPHCHGLWPDGQASVSIATWEVIRGDALPPEARELVYSHRGEIERAWQDPNARK